MSTNSACPRCSKPTSGPIVGALAFPDDKRMHQFSWHVCWDCEMAKPIEAMWVSLNRPSEKKTKPQWTKHTQYHWQMRIGGELLEYWPTKNKFRWKEQTHKGDPMKQDFIKEAIG